MTSSASASRQHPSVSLLPHANYDAAEVEAALARLLAPLGGMPAFVAPGAKVLLKPNLVLGRHPDKAVNTHPAVVRAAARLAYAAGAGVVLLGDSPGLGSAASAAQACGIAAAAAECGVRLIEFTPVEHIDRSRRFVRLELAREALEADAVINLPKMKTHGQMMMTLAVKNMFGAVPGARKFQWHYRAGRDRLLFARMINEIALAVRPGLTILDAVVGMDGAGPTAGRARPIGFFAASADPWAIDAAVMDILGLERKELPTLAAAAEHGPREWMDAAIVGAEPADLRPADWQLPAAHTLQMHGAFVERHFPRLARWLRDRLAPPPAATPGCTACGVCVGICPAGAMRLDGGRLAIDAAACIRCYCCHELCPRGGMDLPRPGRLAGLLGLGG